MIKVLSTAEMLLEASTSQLTYITTDGKYGYSTYSGLSQYEGYKCEKGKTVGDINFDKIVSMRWTKLNTRLLALEAYKDVSKLFKLEPYNGTIAVNFDKNATLIENIHLMCNPKSIGEVSDGYHTFNELYHHRALLTASLFNQNREVCWKSKLHHDGTMYQDMFIVGMSTYEGYATYHYDVDPYWDMFNVPEREHAPEWDGHTPDESISRIYNYVEAITLVEE